VGQDQDKVKPMNRSWNCNDELRPVLGLTASSIDEVVPFVTELNVHLVLQLETLKEDPGRRQSSGRPGYCPRTTR
jgi:hypothetical protein